MTTTDRSVVHDGFALERTYPASPERVFAAWSTIEFKQQWFGGEHDNDVVTEHTMDFRVGGRERMAGAITGGPTYLLDATYQDIVDGHRIVWSYDIHLDGRRISVSLATVEITGAPGGAHLVYTEHSAYLDGLDTNDQRRAGTVELLDTLGTTFA